VARKGRTVRNTADETAEVEVIYVCVEGHVTSGRTASMVEMCACGHQSRSRRRSATCGAGIVAVRARDEALVLESAFRLGGAEAVLSMLAYRAAHTSRKSAE